MREVTYPSPGEVLLQEFLEPMGITQYRLARRSACRSAEPVRSSPAPGRSEKVRWQRCGRAKPQGRGERRR